MPFSYSGIPDRLSNVLELTSSPPASELPVDLAEKMAANSPTNAISLKNIADDNRYRHRLSVCTFLLILIFNLFKMLKVFVKLISMLLFI